jgi:hypothetical protein
VTDPDDNRFEFGDWHAGRHCWGRTGHSTTDWWGGWSDSTDDEAGGIFSLAAHACLVFWSLSPCIER